MPARQIIQKRSSDEFYARVSDFARTIFLLAAIAVIGIYAYLLYGLFSGDVGQWGTLKAPEQIRIAHNINNAIYGLNFALGILLICACFLFYDEESAGYLMVGGSVALYYGVPFLIDMFAPGQVAVWAKAGNRGALDILNQFKTAAIMLALPGGILTVRDLILRITDGASRNREDYAGMAYGGKVQEQAKASPPIIGMFAKCWQLPFCRPAIRKGCPIYQVRTKCWKERVGCMCEEAVIRHSMDTLISKQDLSKSGSSGASPIDDVVSGLTLTKTEAPSDLDPDPKPVKVPTGPAPTDRPKSRKEVRIPHNPNIPMSVKVERCRNCVIFNEHQRMKYQFFAPIIVLAIPGLAIYRFDFVSGILNNALKHMDQVMKNLALTAAETNKGQFELGAGMVEYVVIGCLVVILTTMALRVLEYVVFQMKI